MQRRGRAQLFWALRGGGWDLGVVSGLEYRAHPIGLEVCLLFLTYPRAEARQVLVRLRAFMDDASREASAQAVCMTLDRNRGELDRGCRRPSEPRLHPGNSGI